jgi:hypothetical protein
MLLWQRIYEAPKIAINGDGTSGLIQYALIDRGEEKIEEAASSTDISPLCYIDQPLVPFCRCPHVRLD